MRTTTMMEQQRRQQLQQQMQEEQEDEQDDDFGEMIVQAKHARSVTSLQRSPTTTTSTTSTASTTTTTTSMVAPPTAIHTFDPRFVSMSSTLQESVVALRHDLARLKRERAEHDEQQVLIHNHQAMGARQSMEGLDALVHDIEALEGDLERLKAQTVSQAKLVQNRFKARWREAQERELADWHSVQSILATHEHASAPTQKGRPSSQRSKSRMKIDAKTPSSSSSSSSSAAASYIATTAPRTATVSRPSTSTHTASSPASTTSTNSTHPRRSLVTTTADDAHFAITAGAGAAVHHRGVDEDGDNDDNDGYLDHFPFSATHDHDGLGEDELDSDLHEMNEKIADVLTLGDNGHARHSISTTRDRDRAFLFSASGSAGSPAATSLSSSPQHSPTSVHHARANSRHISSPSASPPPSFTALQSAPLRRSSRSSQASAMHAAASTSHREEKSSPRRNVRPRESSTSSTSARSSAASDTGTLILPMIRNSSGHPAARGHGNGPTAIMNQRRTSSSSSSSSSSAYHGFMR